MFLMRVRKCHKLFAYLLVKLTGCGNITLYICEHKRLRKVDIFVIRPQDGELFHLGVKNRENKHIKFVYNITRSGFSAFRIAEMKQETFCWLYQSQVIYSNQHNCNSDVPLMKTLKQKRPFFYYSAADILS